MRISSLIQRMTIFSLLTLLLGVSAFAQTSASLSGIVQDPNGGVVNNAKVTVSDPAKGLQLETTTNSEGIFTFSTLQPGTYTVTIEATGFKKVVKSGIVLNVADKQSTGRITLEVGAVENTVEITADAAQLLIKTESGEQSQVISGEQVSNLALNGRNYLDLVKLTPGVVSFVNAQTAGPGGLGGFNINGTRANQHNLTIDGTTNVDTGSNGTQHIALVLDNIAEFKILTSNYQAEYGRSAGGDIKVVTKGGGKEFHGTGYYFHRHEQFNANSYLNNADRNQRNFYRYNYQGFNIGGPVWLPGKVFGPLGTEALKEKLFWFFSREWQEQLLPSATRQSRVPTALEAAGNFSQTRDGNNNPIFIRDPLRTGACTATDQTACFPGNIIPANRINPSTASLLRLLSGYGNFPLASSPNGAQFNHNSQASAGYPRGEYNIRIDYNMTENTRMFVRYTRDSDQQVLPYGLGWTGGNNQFPFDNLIFRQAPAWNGTLNVTSTLSPTLTNEFVFGASQNNLTLNPSTQIGTFAGLGFNFATPFPYPTSQWVNISFGGIPNQNFAAPTGYSQFPYKNSNTTFDFYDNVSKVWGTHTAKAGIYVQRSRKDQAAGTSMNISFQNNPVNPDNSQHPYANALLGNFDSYSQSNRPIYQGQYRSTNVEWYLQDNWKATRRLTLDYGLRFNWIQPQFDGREQTSFFDPAGYDRSKAVRLYNRAANGQAFDPANPTVLLPAFLIGRIVPNSGEPFNGMRQSAQGFERGGFKNRGIQYGPAFGFAYDVFGNSKTVVRGGYRIGYDRVSGNNVIFPAAEQPPFLVTPTFNFANLATVGNTTGGIALGVSNVRGADFEGHIPNVQSFSFQVQQDLGFDTVLSVGYVGTLSRHLPEDLNINYIPYGTLFTKAAQDPSRYANGVVPDEEPNLPQIYRDAGLKFTGQFALPANFLRRFPGYGNVQMKTFGGSSNYHSLQVTAQRRYRRGLTLGMAYTWSKALGTAQDAEGNYINPVCSRCYDYRVLSFDRTHTMVVNYLYDLPKLKSDNWFVKGALNGWQVTGVTQFLSGQPTELNPGIPNIDVNQRIIGTYEEGQNAIRVRPSVNGDPQGDITAGFQEGGTAFDYTKIRLPNLNPGPQPRTFIRRPGINVTDLSFFKSFPFGGDGSRYLQLRLETFNIFNHAQFDNINTGLTYEIASDFSNYAARQQGGTGTLRGIRNGTFSPATGRLGRAIGEFSGQPGFVSANRTLQLAVKIFF